jgi:proteic killer suppression protein
MVQRLYHADSINDLRKPPSNKFEKLQGTGNMFSLRLNVKYRLEITIDFEDKEKTKGTVTVVKISKHYE